MKTNVILDFIFSCFAERALKAWLPLKRDRNLFIPETWTLLVAWTLLIHLNFPLSPECICIKHIHMEKKWSILSKISTLVSVWKDDLLYCIHHTAKKYFNGSRHCNKMIFWSGCQFEIKAELTHHVYSFIYCIARYLQRTFFAYSNQAHQ